MSYPKDCRDHGVSYEGPHGLGCGCALTPSICECVLDDCFGDACPYCARLDPGVPCPVADSDPAHAALLYDQETSVKWNHQRDSEDSAEYDQGADQ